MSQGRSIIDIIKYDNQIFCNHIQLSNHFLFSRDPAALESFLRGSSKSVDILKMFYRIVCLFFYFQSTDSSNSQRSSADSNRTTPTNIYNQNTTNNTNVQITQNTFNFNTNPSLLNPSTQQNLLANDSTRVLNQTVGQQTNVNVILNQTVIQQSPTNSTPTATTTTTTTTGPNQQQMVAININGNQTLIPLNMFTKLLQQKYSNTSPGTTTATTTAAAAATATATINSNQPNGSTTNRERNFVVFV